MIDMDESRWVCSMPTHTETVFPVEAIDSISQCQDGRRPEAGSGYWPPKHDVFAKQSDHHLDDRRVRAHFIECPRRGGMALVPIERRHFACVIGRLQKSLALLYRQNSDGACIPCSAIWSRISVLPCKVI